MGRSSIPNPDGIRHLLGHSPEEWAADPKTFWERTIHPDDFARVMSWVEDQSPDPPYSIEYRMRRADGEVIWVRDTALPVFDADGGLLRWQGLIVDVTSMITTREALERSEARYRTLAQQLPAIVYDIGEDDVMTMHNTPALNGLGYTPEEWAAGAYELWRNSLYPEDRDRLEAAWHRSRDTRSAWSSEYRFIGGDGRTLWVRDTAVPIELGQGQGTVWLGIVFDITDLIENAERLQASETRYRLLAEQVPALTYFRTVDGAVSTLVSPGAGRHADRPLRRAVGRRPARDVAGRAPPRRPRRGRRRLPRRDRRAPPARRLLPDDDRGRPGDLGARHRDRGARRRRPPARLARRNRRRHRDRAVRRGAARRRGPLSQPGRAGAAGHLSGQRRRHRHLRQPAGRGDPRGRGRGVGG